MKYIVGIDEVGRGPLAGPVAVGAVCLSDGKINLRKLFPDARDSKKLSPKKREEIFKKIKQAEKKHILRYIVRYEDAQTIDKLGINKAIRNCIDGCLERLRVNPKITSVFLDGGLRAPKKFVFQKTIIRGDDKKIIISLASIVAKVSRDSSMCRLAKKYPKYGLEIHKGYGTARHRSAIKRHGLSIIHRKTFFEKLV